MYWTNMHLKREQKHQLAVWMLAILGSLEGGSTERVKCHQSVSLTVSRTWTYPFTTVRYFAIIRIGITLMYTNVIQRYIIMKQLALTFHTWATLKTTASAFINHSFMCIFHFWKCKNEIIFTTTQYTMNTQ